MRLCVFAENSKEQFELEACEGAKLSQAIWLSGKLRPLPLCNGAALCGKCKIRFLDEPPSPTAHERRFFSVPELDQGWRLACQHYVGKESLIRIALEDKHFLTSERAIRGNSDGQARKQAVLGFDLGTTSVAWRAVEAETSALLAEGCALNPQAAAGPDVISRLDFALSQGTAPLSNLIQSFIENLLSRLQTENLEISAICLAANSAMTEIFLNRDIGGLCAAPYRLSYHGGEIIRISGIVCPVILPPLPGPFVGGDLSAGLCQLMNENLARPFILADLGTNGELALLNEHDQLYYTSVPMGPALEGIGPAMGALAGPLIATSFKLSGAGLEPFDFNGCLLQNCRGISATGYISLLARLYKLGILDDSGRFVKPPETASPLVKKIAGRLTMEKGGLALYLGGGVHLAAGDAELILMVKAAFSVALALLMQKAGCKPENIRNFCIAGVLGQFANVEDLINLGFFPRELGGKTLAVGNASLAGACLLAQKPEKLSCLKAICDSGIALNLAGDPSFQQLYLQSLNWKPTRDS